MFTTNTLNALSSVTIKGKLGSHNDPKGLTLANLYAYPRTCGYFMNADWFDDKMECTKFDHFVWRFFAKLLPIITATVTTFPERYKPADKIFRFNFEGYEPQAFIGISNGMALMCDQYAEGDAGPEGTFSLTSIDNLIERFKDFNSENQLMFIQAIIEFGKRIYLDDITEYGKQCALNTPPAHDMLLNNVEASLHTELMNIRHGASGNEIFTVHPAWCVVDEMLILPAYLITLNSAGIEGESMLYAANDVFGLYKERAAPLGHMTGKRFMDSPDFIYSTEFPLTQSLETAKLIVTTLTGYGRRG